MMVHTEAEITVLAGRIAHAAGFTVSPSEMHERRLNTVRWRDELDRLIREGRSVLDEFPHNIAPEVKRKLEHAMVDGCAQLQYLRNYRCVPSDEQPTPEVM